MTSVFIATIRTKGSKMVKPISPNEIGAAKLKYIPDTVFEVVNELLAQKCTNGRATIYQKDIVAALLTKMDTTKAVIFDKGYLNFEEAYREQGWKVEYDKPAYNESYDAHFIFKVK
jgi:hypothetical protein